MTTATVKVSGETTCLGWCGKKFWSPDKIRIRFCPKCRSKRNNTSESLSRLELRQLGRYTSVEEPTNSED
jgi:Zn finger protein HypA/HybF involved in hydrogenase expression